MTKICETRNAKAEARGFVTNSNLELDHDSGATGVIAVKTVGELIEDLKCFPADHTVALNDPDTGWELPISLIAQKGETVFLGGEYCGPKLHNVVKRDG